MATIILIHGSWHGGWCWDDVVAPLQAAGHRVLAPDLLGMGDDGMPPSDVTLARWTEQIAQLVDSQPEPVLLVGHSRGGIVISEAAEARPDGIAALVYLCAFLPQSGESLFQLAQTDEESLILPELAIDEARGVHSVRREKAHDIFYGTSPASRADDAVSRLKPEPNAPIFTPLHLTAENFGRVPRYYVRCARDRAVGPALQDRMVAASPCRTVYSLDTDHSPFFSAPAELVDILLVIAGEVTAPGSSKAAPDTAIHTG
jgi:pimeloyl-ACP methyl ester carboxylesterase